ncbi:MAG TPA: hypothetical protein VF389_05665, partial [Woeseiaceae bacterium]
MSPKFMIIDGQADFRTLLMHHVTTHWPEAIISSYDPTSDGHLPDEFSGAGNDILLLGDNQGNRSGLQTLKKFLKTPGFPPVVYFCSNREMQLKATDAGVPGIFLRNRFKHDEF